MRKGSKSIFVFAGIIACFVFVVVDLGSDLWFGMHIPKYNWLTESISRLGQPGSPFEDLVMIWGFCFAFLLLLFANAFRLVFPPSRITRLATIAICIYAIGEGVGSGLFPIDPLKAADTLSGTLHEVLSGIGDAGIVLLPFILFRIDYFKEKRKFRTYLKFVIGIGFSCLALFLFAKYAPRITGISNYKGLWQRIYTLNYHVMLIILNFEMIGIVRENRTLARD